LRRRLNRLNRLIRSLDLRRLPRRWRLDRLRGPWRVRVEEGSMIPAIEPGDWLLVDPTTRRWPRLGSVVVFREPDSDDLAVKRVAARAGERVAFAGGFIVMGPGEAWLTADATTAATAESGYGPPIDSNRFGPVPLEHLVGRVWFRYAPLARIGSIPRKPG
jgi:signal peptidase I